MCVVARTMALPGMNAVLVPQYSVRRDGREHDAREPGGGQRKRKPGLFGC
jgi:hypothetical protein